MALPWILNLAEMGRPAPTAVAFVSLQHASVVLDGFGTTHRYRQSRSGRFVVRVLRGRREGRAAESSNSGGRADPAWQSAGGDSLATRHH